MPRAFPALASQGLCSFSRDNETGLLDRLGFVSTLANGEDRGCVVVLRLGGLARVRRAFGYERTAVLIRLVADRIIETAGRIPLGRLESDMLVLLAPTSTMTATHRLVEQVVQACSARFELGDASVEVTLYAGIAPSDDVRAIETARMALEDAYAARTRVSPVGPQARLASADTLLLLRDLRRAIAADELYMAYQPKMRARTQVMDGVEALVRWKHPTRGHVPPDVFVPMTETTGDIGELTDWTIDRALKDQKWLALQGYPTAISLNLSARLVDDRAFTEAIVAKIEGRAAGIGFEITETGVIDDPEAALVNLGLLIDAGAHVSIDDYGSGTSSLDYLKRLPAHELKIDRAFIAGISESHRDPLIVRSTIDLAHALGMEVTAEGVEKISSYALLKAMGCDLIQGYLIARPMPVTELLAFLSAKAPLVQLEGNIFDTSVARSW